ncbi:hypothetical protein [Parafrankia discariae]|uniref:hypothetical protein n=1 Tax=Parafrankia discariae TaxID=365528 RepID=UPI0003756EBD|nr:hypothetical protein [Parafrankia discariae]
MGCRGILGLSGRLGALVVAVIVFAGCSGDSGGSTALESTVQALTPSPAAGAGGPPPAAPTAAAVPGSAPTPLPSSAYPPLAGFGEVHDLGKIVGLSDGPDGTVLSLDRLAYVHCTPRAGEAESCLDGYRIDDVAGARQNYAVTPTVRVVRWVQPEQYETGDLADLREFVATRPSHLVLLRLDAGGHVIAVGQPWLP